MHSHYKTQLTHCGYFAASIRPELRRKGQLQVLSGQEVGLDKSTPPWIPELRVLYITMETIFAQYKIGERHLGHYQGAKIEKLTLGLLVNLEEWFQHSGHHVAAENTPPSLWGLGFSPPQFMATERIWLCPQGWKETPYYYLVSCLLRLAGTPIEPQNADTGLTWKWKHLQLNPNSYGGLFLLLFLFGLILWGNYICM